METEAWKGEPCRVVARQPELPAEMGGETESGTWPEVWSTAWEQADQGV